MAGEQKLQDLKNQIDKSAEGTEGYNKIEIEEMEDFLKYPDNMENLGKAMEEDISPELKEEFTNAMRNLCKEIIKKKTKEVTEDQFRVLLFYLEYFSPEIEEQENVQEPKDETIKNLEKELNEMNMKLNEIQENLEKTQAELDELTNKINLLKQETEGKNNGEDTTTKESELKKLTKEYETKQGDYKAKEKEYSNLEKSIKKQETKIFEEKYNEEFKFFKGFKEKDENYYNVGIFVVSQRKKYEKIISKWFDKLNNLDNNTQDETKHNKLNNKYSKKLNKNPFYRMLTDDERKQNFQESVERMNKRLKFNEIQEKRLNVLDTTTNEYEKDREKVENILEKEGELTKEEQETLYYFLDYYQNFNNTYTAKPGIDKNYSTGRDRLIGIIGDNTIYSTVYHGYNINNTLNSYINLFHNGLKDLEYTNHEIRGWENLFLDSPEEKEKDIQNPIRSVIRGLLSGNKNPSIDNSFYDDIARRIDKKLNSKKFDAINNFINGKLNKNSDLVSINDWYKEFGKNHPELTTKLREKISTEINNITTSKLKKENTDFGLEAHEIKLFQLRANIEHGEDLDVNGKINPLSPKNPNITAGEITNLYIHRQRLTVRESKNYKNILKIPNINDLLNRLNSKDKQHKALKSLLIFLFEIEKSGIKYEDRIGGQAFSILFDNIISSEIYEGKKIEDEIKTRESMKEQAEMMIALGLGNEALSVEGSESSLTFNDIIEECEEMLKGLRSLKLKKGQDLGNYYDNATTSVEKGIRKQRDALILQDRIEALNQKLNNMFSLMKNLPKLKENATPEEESQYQINYKNAYMNIAKTFINIWRQDKQYISETLSSQIFTEIYCLRRKDGIASIFGNDVFNECQKYRSRLDSFSESENRKNEEIVDTYFQLQDANEFGGRCEENHFDEDSKFAQIVYDEDAPKDTIMPEIVMRQYKHAYGYTIHKDNYRVGNDIEQHGTIVAKYEVGGTLTNPGGKRIIATYHGYNTPNYNPNSTIIPPDPHGWYAILPENLKQKSRQGKIKLAIVKNEKGIKEAYVYEFEDGTDIKMYKIDKHGNVSKTPKIITVEEYNKALTIESNRQKTWEAEHGEELKDIQKQLAEIVGENGKNAEVNNLYNERAIKDLDGNEANALRRGAIELYNLTEKFYKNRDKLIQLKASLQKLNQNSNYYENPYEKQIKEYIKNIDNILGFATKEQVEQALNFKNKCCNTGLIHENDNRYDKTRQDRVVIAAGFVSAVLVVCGIFTFGTSSAAGLSLMAYMGIGAASTFTGMAASEIASRAVDGTGGGSITVDGVEYSLNYNNPTLLKQAINGDISWSKCIASYGRQFVSGTVLQGLLMRGGSYVSQFLTKNFFAKVTPGSFADRLCKFTSFILTREKAGDPFTSRIATSIGNQAAKKGFLRSFVKELTEESCEEVFENAAQSQGYILGAVATFINCIKPRAGMQLELTGVSNPNIDIPEGQGTAFVESTYDSNNPDNINTLRQYYENQKGYSVKEENGILTVTAHGVKIDTEENGELTTTEKDIQMTFKPSKAPLEIRNLPPVLRIIGNISVNEETGQVYYESTERLEILGTFLETHGQGSIQINNDGTSTLTIGGNTVELARKPGSLSEKPQLTEQQIKNSLMMDNTLEELSKENITEKEKSEILKNLRKSLNDQYKQETGQDLNLSDEQLFSILDAHEEDGILGELTLGQLRVKVKILAETVSDPKIRRFLLEKGFCGQMKTNIHNITENLTNPLTVEGKKGIKEKQKNNKENIDAAEQEIAKELRNLDESIKKAEEELKKAVNTGLKPKIDTAKEKLEALEAKKKMINSIYEEIQTHIAGLQGFIEGRPIRGGPDNPTIYANTIEEFLRIHQLGLFEGSTKLDGTKLKYKKLDGESQRLLVKYYYEAVLKPLGINCIADPKLTLGKKVNENFLDTEHSKNFEITENDEFGYDVNGRKTDSKVENVGNKILEQIAVNEGRNKSKPSDGAIENTVEKQIENITDATEKKIATELWASIQKHSQGKISKEDQAFLFGMSMKYMAELRVLNQDLKPQEVFKLLNSNQNKILHEHLWDLNTITSSDHGIKHILRGNMTNAENIFRQLDEGIKINLGNGSVTTITRETLHNQYKSNGGNLGLDVFKARLKVLTRQAIIDHDLGYTNLINAAFDKTGFGKGYYMLSDHPLRSTIRVDEHSDLYKNIFGEDGYNAILNSLPGHGSAQTQNVGEILNGLANETDFVRGLLSCADCAGSPADFKIAHLMSQKEVIGPLFNAYYLFTNGDINGAKQVLTNLIETVNNIDDKGDPEFYEIKKSFINGIDAFLTNKDLENIKTKEDFKNAFGFHFKKFLGAFGVKTTLDTNGNPTGRINEHGGWSIDFELAGESFELLAESFGAGMALKAFISVCNDYHIDEDGPTIKFLEWQMQNAINQRKNDKKDGRKNNNGEPKSLKEYITETFNHSPTEEEISEFNKHQNNSHVKYYYENGKFYTHDLTNNKKITDNSEIDFNPDRGIIIKGPNDVEIPLHFDGGKYEGFSETGGRFSEMHQKINEYKEAIEKEKDNPSELKKIAQNAATDLANFGNTASLDKPWLNTKEREPITNEIAAMADQTEISANELIDCLNKLASTYTITIQQIQPSNPGIETNSTIDLRRTVTQEQKNKIKERLTQSQASIEDTEKALNLWAEGEGGKDADSITAAKEKINRAKKALENRINGTGKQYNTIEDFLEEHQLGLFEGITEIKTEIIKDGEEDLTRLERYQLGLDDPEIKIETKKRKKMDNKSKMLLTNLYYEAVFKPLGIETFVDPHLTIGGNVDNQTFLDTEHSENFEITEKDEFGYDKDHRKTDSKAESVGNKILEQIAVNEGRNKSKSSDGAIENTVNNQIENITDVTEKKIATELWASIQEHSQGKISKEDQAYLFAISMKQMADYRTAYPNKKPEQVFKLLNSNQNKLLHQHLRDLNTITSSDHGIKHVLRGNATLAENVFNQISDNQRESLFISQNGRSPNDKIELNKFKAKLRVLTRQAIIDHDLGYTNIANKAFDETGFGKGFHMVSDHPLRSTIWVENNQDFYKGIFDEDGYNAIKESLPGHGSAQTKNIAKILNGSATEIEFVRGILSCVDCAGSPADYKIAYLFAHSGAIGQLFNAYKLLNDGNISGAKQALTNLIETIKSMPDTGEISGIKESRINGINAFITNKKHENMSSKELGKAFGFHFNKFLGAFGIMTSIDSETGMANIGINENGGWYAEFELSGKSFELLAEAFGAETALKSFIGVCDDYSINDKGPTSKFIVSQVDKAINDWKSEGKKQPLKDYIRKRLNPNSSTYKTDLNEFVAKFNEKGRKDSGSEWKEVSINEQGHFTQDGKIESQIQFSENGITILGPNNVEITLNFDGKSYEGFSNIVEIINIIDSEANEHIKTLERSKDNPENLETMLPVIGNDLTALGDLLSEIPGIDTFKFNAITERIVNLSSGEGKRSYTHDGDCRLTKYDEDDNITGMRNFNDVIEEFNGIRSACQYLITEVQGSNPSLNN